MQQKIFVNLPVRDLKRSMSFYQALGFSNEPKFTDDNAACMILSEEIYVMLLMEPYFKTFTPKQIVDARSSTEVLLAINVESRAAVDETVKKALAAGGSTYNEPKDHGFMYQHGYQDPDGHIWEIFWMDPNAVPNG